LVFHHVSWVVALLGVSRGVARGRFFLPQVCRQFFSRDLGPA
jgi:hypothetical protein